MPRALIIGGSLDGLFAAALRCGEPTCLVGGFVRRSAGTGRVVALTAAGARISSSSLGLFMAHRTFSASSQKISVRRHESAQAPADLSAEDLGVGNEVRMYRRWPILLKRSALIFFAFRRCPAGDKDIAALGNARATNCGLLCLHDAGIK